MRFGYGYRPGSKSLGDAGARGFGRFVVCTILLMAASAADAQMTLTPIAVSRGFTLSDYSVGFPSDCDPGIGGGVNCVAYLPNGKVLATDIADCYVYALSNHQPNPPRPVLQYYCNINCTPFSPCQGAPWGFVQLELAGTWHFYGTWAVGGFREFDPATGNWINTTFGTPPVSYAGACVAFPPAVAGPLHNHVFAMGAQGGGSPQILDIDVVSGNVVPYDSIVPQGMAFSEDGATLYATLGDSLVALDVATHVHKWAAYSPSVGLGSEWTGVAAGVGNLGPYVYGLTNAGDLWEIVIPPPGPNPVAINLIASGGSRGSFLCPDADVPCAGGYPSLIIPQCDRLLRLDPPGGGWIGVPTSSLSPVASTTAVPTPDRAGEVVRLAIAPNPTTGPTRIDFTLATQAPIHLDIVDLQGRAIAVLADGPGERGPHSIEWDGAANRGRAQTGRVRPGFYFVRLVVGDQTFVRPAIITR